MDHVGAHLFWDVFQIEEKMIAEREKAEQMLQYSEERYHAIFEQAADSIVLIDAETGAFVEFNQRAHENLGFTRREFKKLQISDFEVIESAEKVEQHIKKIVNDGRDTFETKHRTKGGEVRDILVSSRAISIREKGFIQSIWTDITERKREEEILRESQERYGTVLEASPDPIVVYDMEGKVIYLSSAFTRVFGWTQKQLLGKKIDYVPEENWPETQQMIDRVQAGESFSGIESRRYTSKERLLMSV